MKKDAVMGRRAYCWLAVAAFVLDRVSKIWAQGALPARPKELWPGVLRLVYVENRGAAFGILQGQQGLLIAVTALGLLALLAFLLVRPRALPRTASLALWLMLGGAAGNLYDRIVYGYVIDFLEVTFISFPVFNVADICVVVAFLLMIGWILLDGEMKTSGG